jgi:site-specific DNA-methyltransferase (adenine-specific)
MLELNQIYCMDNVQGMKQIDDNSIDLTVTSPPYSDLRDYKKYKWDFYAVAKNGGCVVCVVGDKTIGGTEELIPYKQCLYFNEIGFNVWDTMIYLKDVCPFPANVRYNQMFEFMFVFTKGKPNTFNPLKENKSAREIEKILKGNTSVSSSSFRDKDGNTKRADSDERMLNRLKNSATSTVKTMGNVWKFDAGYMKGTKDKIAFDHPATFPDKLAEDHILSWSNENDIVFDPFSGSGTTLKMAKKNNRRYLGFEISEEYCKIAENRLQLI